MNTHLPNPAIYLISNRGIFSSADEPPEIRLIESIEKAVRGGVNMVQVREPGLPARELLSLGNELRKITDGRALLFVNDRVDIAMAIEADGVQLGEHSMPIPDARGISNGKLLIGKSVHDLYGAIDADQNGADFLVLGTIFQSKSHPGIAPSGTGLIYEATTNVSIPVIGIGGINPSNADEVIAAGGSGIAVLRSVLTAEDPKKAASEIRAAVQLMSVAAGIGELI